MNPTTTGIAVAVAVIVAFAAGSVIEFEDGSIELNNPIETQGPLEQAGEALDNATK